MSARVEISAAGHAVVVEANEPLDRVADKAMQVWRDTDSPRIVTGFGFVGIGEPQWVDVPDEVPMPARLAGGDDVTTGRPA